MAKKDENVDDVTSMRDDFESAITSIENDDDDAVTTQTEEEASLNAEPEGDTTDAEGKTAEKKATAEETKGEVSEEEPDAAGKRAASDDSNIGDGETDKGDGKIGADKAPASWTPAAREGWKDIPEPVRAQINKRETEINKALNDGAEHRKTGEKFSDLAGRYAQVIAAEGATDPLTGVEELMKTVATLRMGSPEQKAQKIAGFIKHYGIPIETLDGILAGQIGGQPPADDPMARMIDDRMKPVNDLLSRMDENTRRQNFDNNQKAINDVATFKQEHEFYPDVQDDMADLVELAGKRNITMPLQEAYDKACAMNPEVANILSKRSAAAVLLDNQDDIAKKREAASSIRGTQGGPPDKSGVDTSMRDTLADAFDAQVG